MDLWDIKVLYYGKISATKGVLTPRLDMELPIQGPYLGFLLQNGSRNILVDSGIGDHFIVDGKAWGGFPAEGGRKFVEKALKDMNIDPLEIDTVVYTHLHNDHAANADLFREARFFFQTSEWEALLNPLPIMEFRRDYDPALAEQLKKLHCVKVHGDFKLADGIHCYLTPGHTPGSQAVAVQTEKGIRVLVGDHWHMYCMAFSSMEEMVDLNGDILKITPPPEVYGQFIPSSLICNFYDYYESCDKIMSLIPENKPEYIVPGHDAALLHNGI